MFSTDVKLNYVSSKFNSRIPNKKGFCIDPFILTAIFAISIRYYFIRLVYSFFVLSVICLLFVCCRICLLWKVMEKHLKSTRDKTILVPRFHMQDYTQSFE